MLIFLLFIISKALAQSADLKAPKVIDLQHQTGPTSMAFIKESADQVLNIQWWIFNLTDGIQMLKKPQIQVFGKSSKEEKSLMANLDSEMSDLLDEPYWPVYLHSFTRFEVVLEAGFVYSLHLSPEDNIPLFLDHSVMARLPPSRLGASFEINVENNGLKMGDKIMAELDICTGVLGDLEIQYRTTKGPYPLKYRKQRLDGKVLGTPYLLPMEVLNNSQAYRVDMFKHESADASDVIFRLKLYKINNVSLVNMIAMHQVMDNIDYPANAKVSFKETANDVVFSLAFNQYLLDLHNITSPISYSLILSSENSDDLNFRLQCSVDRLAFLSNRNTGYKKDQSCKRQVVKTEGEFRTASHTLNFAAKRLLFFKNRVFTASSGVVTKHPTVFQSRQYWSSKSADTSEYTSYEKFVFGVILALILALSIVLYLAIKKAAPSNPPSTSSKSHSLATKAAKVPAQQPNTQVADDDDESKALNRQVEMTAR